MSFIWTKQERNNMIENGVKSEVGKCMKENMGGVW